MPAVTQDQALQLLSAEVQKYETDELLEVYNEVFPAHPSSLRKARKDPSPLVRELIEYIHSGLEIDQIIDLWGVILPRDHHLWYNEIEETIHYNEETESVPYE